jgi:hypothetical protein
VQGKDQDGVTLSFLLSPLVQAAEASGPKA